jgi:hypothetical protein
MKLYALPRMVPHADLPFPASREVWYLCDEFGREVCSQQFSDEASALADAQRELDAALRWAYATAADLGGELPYATAADLGG